MVELQHLLILLGLFLLRIGVPLAITLGLGYVLIRLDERWKAEAQAEREAREEREERVPARRPTVLARQITPAVASPPCWQVKDCDPVQRITCPAWNRPELPCWLAHMKADGALPDRCPECTLFVQELHRIDFAGGKMDAVQEK